jgi:hypothetical protein
MLITSEASRPDLGKTAVAGGLTNVQQLLDQGTEVNGHNIMGEAILENAICDGNSNPSSEGMPFYWWKKVRKPQAIPRIAWYR